MRPLRPYRRVERAEERAVPDEVEFIWNVEEVDLVHLDLREARPLDLNVINAQVLVVAVGLVLEEALGRPHGRRRDVHGHDAVEAVPRQGQRVVGAAAARHEGRAALRRPRCAL